MMHVNKIGIFFSVGESKSIQCDPENFVIWPHAQLHNFVTYVFLLFDLQKLEISMMMMMMMKYFLYVTIIVSGLHRFTYFWTGLPG